MGGKGRHLKPKIIKFDVPHFHSKKLYKIPFIGLMDWRVNLEEPVIAVVDAGNPEMPASVWAEIT